MTDKGETEKPLNTADNEDTLSPASEADAPLAQPKNDGLSDISGELIETMPDVSDETVASAEADKEAVEGHKSSWSHLRDRDGNSFDPDHHQTNDDGTPKTGKGDYLLKRRGRKKGSGNSHHSSVVSRPGQGAQGMQDSGQNANQTAAALESGRAAANLVFAVGMAIGGEEWQPIKDSKHGLDEKLQLESAFGQYFLATGKTDIPPGWALTISLGSYALPRLAMPKTQTRAKSVMGKLKAWWINRKADKELKSADKDK